MENNLAYYITNLIANIKRCPADQISNLYLNNVITYCTQVVGPLEHFKTLN